VKACLIIRYIQSAAGCLIYSEVAKVNVRHTGAGMLTGQLEAREIQISGSNGSGDNRSKQQQRK